MGGMCRLGHVVWLTAVLLGAGIRAGAESAEVNLDYVAARALERAQTPFHSPRADLPPVLRQDRLDYDKYREIRFRRDKALWTAADAPFRIEFFHPGYLYQEPVHVNEFTLTHVQPIRFVQDFFDYGESAHSRIRFRRTPGYAGFRVLYPLNAAEPLDELGAFLGASYFRLLGKDQRYGLSARGLALNCGRRRTGPEEFPIFTDWWLGKPQQDDTELRLFAILDSVSCTGAYEFLIRPGETTVAQHRRGVVFPRDRKTRGGQPQPLAGQDARPGAVDEHVLVRQKFGAQAGRLPAGGSRQRRPARPHGQRRDAVAAAGQSAGDCGTRFSTRRTSGVSA